MRRSLADLILQHLDGVPGLYHAAFQDNGKNPLSGHDTVAYFFSDLAALVALLANLGDLLQGLADFQAGAHRQLINGDALRGDVFSEIAGLKLAGALDSFQVDPADLSCLDVGCSTGGFTDCLLQRGAARVLSVDVGRAQFAWSLRNDGRVTLFERTNIADLPALGYTGCCDLAVCDVSFTSVEHVLPAVLAALNGEGRFLTLVKPQFEAAPEDVGAGGVVSDPAVWARVLQRNIHLFAENGLFPVDICASPIKGAKGNHEFFLLGDRARFAATQPQELSAHIRTLEEKAGRL